MSQFFDDFLNELNLASLQAQGELSIIEFANRIIFNNDEVIQLYPTQKAILKAFYNEPLDPDEKEILQNWVNEERSTWVEDRRYISLVLEAGRRASKCNAASAPILTTKGELTYQELYNALKGGERIGIYTYDFDDEVVDSYITYDIKAEKNAYEDVYEVKTTSGKTETTNDKHPYYVWRYNSPTPQWIELKDLQVGDWVATSAEIPVFGSRYLGDDEAQVAAFFICCGKKHGKLVSPLNKRRTSKLLTKCFQPTEYNYNKGNITLISNYIQQYYESITPDNFRNLDKESLIKLLKYIISFGWKPPEDGSKKKTFGFQLHVNPKFKSLLQRQFLQLGVLIQIRDAYLNFSMTESVHTFFAVFGWDVFGDARSTKEMTGALGLCGYMTSLDQKIPEGVRLNLDLPSSLQTPRTKDKCKRYAIEYNNSYVYDMCTNNINWERVSSITPRGKQNTIALEVAGTHVIGSPIITHNSTMASIIALKEFYDLIIMDDPHKHYGMFPGSPIAILVMAQSQAQVKETIFAAIKGYAENSNFFSALKDAGTIEILSEEIRCAEKNVAIYAKHTNSKSLVGYTLKCMILDEVARFETTGDEGKNKAFEIWRNVATGGAAFGTSFKKVAISSAWEPNDPIEVLYEDAKRDPNTLGFQLTTFQINLQLIKGVTPVIVSDYTTDYIKARREYEGIRFSKFNTFIDIINLQRSAVGISAIDAMPHDIDISTAAGDRHYAGVKIMRIAANPNPQELGFIHIDPALKKDSAALALARPTKVDGKWKISVDALLKWEPHTDKNGMRRIVSYIDIEERLNDIIPARNVARVTFDQWNSASFVQKLHSQGVDSQVVSCSREAQFSYYTLFRDLLAHDYIILPRDSLWSNGAITELSELVMKPNKQIVHPYAGKDLADAIVNAVFQCHQYMVRSGLNITTGLNTGIVQSQNLSKVTKFKNHNLKIGSAINKLYNRR